MSSVELKKVSGINGKLDSNGTNGAAAPNGTTGTTELDDVEIKTGKDEKKKKEPMTGVFEVVRFT